MAAVLVVVLTGMGLFMNTVPPEGAEPGAEATRTLVDAYGAGALLFIAPPLILVGNGTGLAGLRAHLHARVAAGARRNWLLFGERNADREMPFFGQERLIASEARGPLTEPEYLEAVSTIQRLARQEGIDAVMDEHRLDALVAPTMGPAWLTDHIMGDRFDGGDSAGPAAIGATWETAAL